MNAFGRFVRFSWREKAMPCGGINYFGGESDECWVCGKDGAKHFCFEWDTFIHGKCVPDFLISDEGRIVIEHGHEVHIYPALDQIDSGGDK